MNGPSSRFCLFVAQKRSDAPVLASVVDRRHSGPREGLGIFLFACAMVVSPCTNLLLLKYFSALFFLFATQRRRGLRFFVTTGDSRGP